MTPTSSLPLSSVAPAYVKTLKPRAVALHAAGTNCDAETIFAIEQAGGAAESVHVNRVFEQPSLLDNFDLLLIPGGFSYGDDVGSGKIFAVELRHKLARALTKFFAHQRLALGICNGFQVLLKAGLLPHGVPGLSKPATELGVTLTWNDTRRYECRWVHLSVDPHAAGVSPFLKGVSRMWLPSAHGEGKIIATATELAALEAQHRIAFRYIDPATGQPTQEFPANPNGSCHAIAGLIDPSGRILGLMPHPERHILPTHRPDWTRHKGTVEAERPGDGLILFKNAIEYLRG